MDARESKEPDWRWRDSTRCVKRLGSTGARKSKASLLVWRTKQAIGFKRGSTTQPQGRKRVLLLPGQTRGLLQHISGLRAGIVTARSASWA